MARELVRRLACLSIIALSACAHAQEVGSRVPAEATNAGTPQPGSPDQGAQAQETARARHFLGLVSEQSVYNLMKRTVELEVIPAARAYGMAFMPYSPLAGGMLGGKRPPAAEMAA